MSLTTDQQNQINAIKANIEALTSKQESIRQQAQIDLDALQQQISIRQTQRDTDINDIQTSINTFQTNINLIVSPHDPAPEDALKHAQAIRIAQLGDTYNEKLTEGFNSSATGIQYHFGYNEFDQKKFIKVSLMTTKNKISFPVVIPDINGVPVLHTAEQYDALENDISIFEWVLQNKLEVLTIEVKALTIVEDVVGWIPVWD